MNTSVRMLKAILDGLPEASIVKLSVDDKLYDFEMAGITRTQSLPNPNDPQANRKYHAMKEYIILADNGNFQMVRDVIDVKPVFKAIKGRAGQPDTP